jgi:energy-coupling factor transporter ATP-binding protein EcfA2
MVSSRLRARNLGPVPDADVEFGDLTVLVGPQASGKSVFLQTLKLVLDRNHIHDTFGHHNMVFKNDPRAFLSGYYGRGMGGMINANPAPQVGLNGTIHDLEELAKRAKGRGRVRTRSRFIART